MNTHNNTHGHNVGSLQFIVSLMKTQEISLAKQDDKAECIKHSVCVCVCVCVYVYVCVRMEVLNTSICIVCLSIF